MSHIQIEMLGEISFQPNAESAASACYKIHRREMEKEINSFLEWLNDNHSIEIHDMILQDYLKYKL